MPNGTDDLTASSNAPGGNGTPGTDGNGAPNSNDTKPWIPDRKEWVNQQQVTRSVDDRTKGLETKIDALIARIGGEGGKSKSEPPGGAAAAAPDAIAEVNKLRSELAFEKATKGYDDAQMKMLKRLHAVEKPDPAKFDEWFKTTTDELGIKPGLSGASRASGRNMNPGTPAGGGAPPQSVADLPDHVIEAMEPAEFQKRYAEENGTRNPFARRKPGA